jgi:hypothetical protein
MSIQDLMNRIEIAKTNLQDARNHISNASTPNIRVEEVETPSTFGAAIGATVGEAAGISPGGLAEGSLRIPDDVVDEQVAPILEDFVVQPLQDFAVGLTVGIAQQVAQDLSDEDLVEDVVEGVQTGALNGAVGGSAIGAGLGATAGAAAGGIGAVPGGLAGLAIGTPVGSVIGAGLGGAAAYVNHKFEEAIGIDEEE